MAQYLVKIPMSDPDEHTHLMSKWQVNNTQATVSPGHTPRQTLDSYLINGAAFCYAQLDIPLPIPHRCNRFYHCRERRC